MSIQSEVSRIDGAKGALKTAIEGKGVAVPEDTRIEGYAALVAEIPQGTGDMLASVYDPQNKAQDVFAYVDDSVPNITGKADKAVPAAAGNVAALDAEGNLQDSGKPFTAAGIGALPTTGGIMTGAINMHTNALHLDQSEGSYIQAGEYGHVNIVAPGGLSLDQPLPVSSGGTGAAAASVARANLGAAAESHTHTAAAITGGTLGITRGGTGVTSHTDTTYTTARYRASALVSADTDPTTNGVINWTYE